MGSLEVEHISIVGVKWIMIQGETKLLMQVASSRRENKVRLETEF